MSLVYEIIQAILYLFGWLLFLALILAAFGVVGWRRRAGKAAALLAGLLALLLGVAYAVGDVSWRLAPALVRGYYQYDPSVNAPDPLLVPRRPELIIERQLTALLGETGRRPLRPDSPLTDFTIDSVRIDGWRGRWVTAAINATLTFADGEQTQVAMSLPSRGGTILLVPFLGEASRSAYAWYPPESSLATLLQTPAPTTTLRQDAPPVVLQPAGALDVATLGMTHVNPDASLAAVSDLSPDGTMLLDVDLRRGQTSVGSAALRYAAGQTETLVETNVSARALFSPDGRRIAYVRSREGRPLRLVVRHPDGAEARIATVDWMTHHWVGNDQIAYSRNSVVYLHDLTSGDTRALAELPPQMFSLSRIFRVSPDGQRIAYADFNGRLWIKEIDSGRQQVVGWDVTAVGWSPGLAWRDDGQQLLFTTRNTTTLPDQQALWLWDAATGEARPLVRTGPGFLESSAEQRVRLWSACWANDETALLVANLSGYHDDVHLLAARTDGGGVWDVTPAAQPALPYSHCAAGQLAVNASRTAIALYTIGQ